MKHCINNVGPLNYKHSTYKYIPKEKCLKRAIKKLGAVLLSWFSVTKTMDSGKKSRGILASTRGRDFRKVKINKLCTNSERI